MSNHAYMVHSIKRIRCDALPSVDAAAGAETTSFFTRFPRNERAGEADLFGSFAAVTAPSVSFGGAASASTSITPAGSATRLRDASVLCGDRNNPCCRNTVRYVEDDIVQLSTCASDTATGAFDGLGCTEGTGGCICTAAGVDGVAGVAGIPDGTFSTVRACSRNQGIKADMA